MALRLLFVFVDTCFLGGGGGGGEGYYNKNSWLCFRFLGKVLLFVLVCLGLLEDAEG